MIRPHERRLRQDIVDEIEPCLPQGVFHILLVGRLAVQVNETPMHGVATLDMHSGRHLLDQ